MKIANLSLEIIESGYIPPDKNTILISITDIGYNANIKETNYVDIHRFQFEDIEQEEVDAKFEQNDLIPNWATIISDKQAYKIYEILLNNLFKNNIIVHCSAGVSRSGAVTEAALKIGYGLYDFSNLRTINKTVFKKIYENFLFSDKINGFFLKKFCN